jgi:hypothetical protein
VSCTVGDRYYVVFALPDHDHSLICEDIIIRRSDPQGVGAAFCWPPGSNHALEWYIYVTSTLVPPPVDNARFPQRLSGSREEAMTADAASSACPTPRPHLPLPPIGEQ